jgi:hypothetical protein
LRDQIAFAPGHGSEAPPLLLEAAHRLEPLDLELTHQTYLEAFIAAFFAGNFAGVIHFSTGANGPLFDRP